MYNFKTDEQIQLEKELFKKQEQEREKSYMAYIDEKGKDCWFKPRQLYSTWYDAKNVWQQIPKLSKLHQVDLIYFLTKEGLLFGGVPKGHFRKMYSLAKCILYGYSPKQRAIVYEKLNKYNYNIDEELPHITEEIEAVSEYWKNISEEKKRSLT